MKRCIYFSLMAVFFAVIAGGLIVRKTIVSVLHILRCLCVNVCKCVWFSHRLPQWRRRGITTPSTPSGLFYWCCVWVVCVGPCIGLGLKSVLLCRVNLCELPHFHSLCPGIAIANQVLAFISQLCIEITEFIHYASSVYRSNYLTVWMIMCNIINKNKMINK